MIWMSHGEYQQRRYPDDQPCNGSLLIVDREGPTWTVECDKCGFAAGLPARDADPRFRVKMRSELAGFPAKFAGRPFEEDETNRAVKQKIREWLATFKEQPIPSPAIYGLQGRGKTHLLVATCEQLILRHNASVWFRSSAGLLDDLQHAFGDNAEHVRIWNKAVTVDVLALDDVGAEQATDWRGDRLARLVDERYLHDKPILIASNYPPAGWEEMLGLRTVSRLRSMCFPLELAGADRRQTVSA